MRIDIEMELSFKQQLYQLEQMRNLGLSFTLSFLAMFMPVDSAQILLNSILVRRGNHMTNSQLLIAQLQDLTAFLITLRKTDSSVWTAPIGEGKWSVLDIIAHIMAWDMNFMEKIVPKLLRREPVALEEDIDVQGFNIRAVEYGRTLNQEQLLDKAIFYRSQIVSQLKKLPEDAFSTVVPGTNSFTLSSFLKNMFVSHDAHHKKQMEVYLSAREKHKIECEVPMASN